MKDVKTKSANTINNIIFGLLKIWKPEIVTNETIAKMIGKEVGLEINIKTVTKKSNE